MQQWIRVLAFIKQVMFCIEQAYLLIKNCRKRNWCEVSIFQMKNKEMLRELV